MLQNGQRPKEVFEQFKKNCLLLNWNIFSTHFYLKKSFIRFNKIVAFHRTTFMYRSFLMSFYSLKLKSILISFSVDMGLYLNMPIDSTTSKHRCFYLHAASILSLLFSVKYCPLSNSIFYIPIIEYWLWLLCIYLFK